MQKEIAPPMPLTQAKVVGTDYDGQRLDNYLAREMKGAPRRLIYRIIRTGQVRINSRRAEHCTRLQTGDVLRIPDNIRTYFSTAQAAPLALPVLFEDGALLAVNKPSGLAVHGGSGLSHGVIERLRATHSGRFLELVHRIDKGTSGVLLLAKKNSALRSLHAAWRARQVKKRYNLMVFGQWQPQAATITLAIKRTAGDIGSRVADDGREAITRTSLLRQYSNAALLQADISTGRTHQLRVHLAAVGLPIIGDDKYGDFAANRQIKKKFARLYLHASELSFCHPLTSEAVRICAPCPPDFTHLQNQLKKREFN